MELRTVPKVVHVTDLVAAPTKRIQLKPARQARQPLLVRADYLGEDGHLEGSNDIRQETVLLSPDATWGEMYRMFRPVSSFGRLDSFWVRTDGGRTSPRRGKWSPYFQTGQIVGGPSLVLDEIVSETVGHEWFAMLCMWENGFPTFVGLTFFSAPANIVSRVAGQLGVDLSSFEGTETVRPGAMADDAWLAHRDDVVEFRSSNGRLPNKKNDGPEKKLGAWLERQHTSYRKGRLSDERADALGEVNLLPKRTPTWDESLRALEAFVAEHGKLPTRRSDKDLAGWLYNQRYFRSEGRLTDDQVERLSTIPGALSED